MLLEFYHPKKKKKIKITCASSAQIWDNQEQITLNWCPEKSKSFNYSNFVFKKFHVMHDHNI